jgi:N-acetylmuramoyl-L-alanine amidase
MRLMRMRAVVAATMTAAIVVPAGIADAHDDTTYTVRRGDGLLRIARVTGVPVDAILKANGLTLKSVIHPGQVLTIPDGGAPAPAAPAATPAATPTSAGTSSLPKEVAGRADLVPVFQSAAREAGVPADLLMAVAYHESRWRADAVSGAGALGIGQLMPGTATWIARDVMGEPNLNPRNATDNIRISAHLLKYLLDQAGGDVTLALAMYAQGEDGARRGIKPATTKFIETIASTRRQFD